MIEAIATLICAALPVTITEIDPLPVIAPQGASSRFAARCLDAFEDDCFHAQADAGAPSRPAILVHDFVASTDMVSCTRPS